MARQIVIQYCASSDIAAEDWKWLLNFKIVFNATTKMWIKISLSWLWWLFFFYCSTPSFTDSKPKPNVSLLPFARCPFPFISPEAQWATSEPPPNTASLHAEKWVTAEPPCQSVGTLPNEPQNGKCTAQITGDKINFSSWFSKPIWHGCFFFVPSPLYAQRHSVPVHHFNL